MTLRRALAFLVSLLVTAGIAQAHVGSSDIFFAGQAGPYPAHVTIRVPPVVPGRAEIDVQASGDSLQVSVLPIYARTDVKNAPPPEPASPVQGEPNLYRGDLWLMSVGAYSIEVRIHGPAGDGTIQIPVNSVATHQLPLPKYLGAILVTFGSLLAFGGLAIVRVAAGESVLVPGAAMGRREHRKGMIATLVTAVIVTLLLIGGRMWWNAEERDFQRHLREGAWPDLTCTIRNDGPQRVLQLTLAEKELVPGASLPLLPDHGKLLHLFLIREPGRDAFAHLHPVRTGGKTFEVALPDLPDGDYRVFCDLTIDGSGLSSTAAATIQLPKAPESSNTASNLKADQDDSWATVSATNTINQAGETICALSGGLHAKWKAHPPLRAKQDAHLQFELVDGAGQPCALEPYMGMMSHAAILRDDNKVFAHLHPTGNFSMATQMFFQSKLDREAAAANGAPMPAEMDHTKMGHGAPSKEGTSTISLPYEFPSPGKYWVFVQFKTGGEVRTTVFTTSVGE